MDDRENLGRMSMHVQDYGDEPEPTLPPGWWIWVYLVGLVFGALVVGVTVAVSRAW